MFTLAFIDFSIFFSEVAPEPVSTPTPVEPPRKKRARADATVENVRYEAPRFL